MQRPGWSPSYLYLKHTNTIQRYLDLKEKIMDLCSLI